MSRLSTCSNRSFSDETVRSKETVPLIHLWLMALYKCIYLLTYSLTHRAQNTTEAASRVYLLDCGIHAWFVSERDEAEAATLLRRRVHHQAQIPYRTTVLEKWYQLVFKNVFRYLAAKYLPTSRIRRVFYCRQLYISHMITSRPHCWTNVKQWPVCSWIVSVLFI